MKNKTTIFIIIIIVCISSILVTKYTIEAISISQLQITIKNIHIQEIKISYAKLKVDIEIFNPTNEDISQLSSDYNIYINSGLVGIGNMLITDIPAGTVKKTSTTIIIYFADVANAAVNAIINQNFNLTINGILQVKIFFDLFSISHEFSSTYIYS
ncbi:MAG: hypothetical protein QHH15_07935 [Candidatus Thermoplasmatota archaeon]|jgi:hypothetical protein|nr:hypothetical protein [Candidatus Thermoplasmatota archaeon]